MAVKRSPRLLALACVSSFVLSTLTLVACGGSPPPPIAPAAPRHPRACEDAYEDLTRYYGADLERRRPAGLREQPFLSACRELPDATQPCLLFSYMQAHTAACERAIHESAEVMHRIAAMTGK